MAYDGLTMAAVAAELQATIDGKIDKIYQPAKDTVLLNLRLKHGGKFRLLISANAMNARVHLTESNFENPISPPMFCMLLRKHIEGGRITSIEQKGLERILIFNIQSYNELRELCQLQLICEVMGKHSNIILVNPETNLILDGIKRYNHLVSRHREVLPGKPYVLPPAQGKKDARNLSYEDMEAGLIKQMGKTLSKALVGLLDGLSPLLAKELIARSNLDEETQVENCGVYEFRSLFDALQGLVKELEAGCPYPSLSKPGAQFRVFSAYKLSQFPAEELLHLNTVNETIDIFYSSQRQVGILTRMQQKYRNTVLKEIERCSKKAVLQKETIDAADGVEDFRIKGEVLLANLYQITQGESSVNLSNFYDPEGTLIAIELQRELTPAQNAEKYFRQYNKTKHAAKKAQIYYDETMLELNYLETVLHDLETASTEEELQDISKELQEQGYLKVVTAKKRKEKPALKKPELTSFLSSDGFTIMVGRNNRQNDYLTLKVAKDKDIWLHTKDLPGSHVIVVNPQGKDLPQQTLLEAGMAAAYFSKGRLGSKIPVDYTERKHVRKPGGAKPGMVIYDNHSTLFITPDEGLVEKLLGDSNNKEA